MIVQQHRAARADAALGDVEPDVPVAIRQDHMFAALRIARDRQPWRELVDMDAVGVGRFGRTRADAERARIERGTPDDPRLGCDAVRMFGESEAPTVLDLFPLKPRSRALRCSRVHTRRHSRDRGAAIPTSAPSDR
jgi:hypothetical protein